MEEVKTKLDNLFTSKDGQIEFLLKYIENTDDYELLFLKEYIDHLTNP